MKRLFLIMTTCLFFSLIGLFVVSPVDPVKWSAPDPADSGLSCDIDKADGVLRASTFLENLPSNPDGLVIGATGDLYASLPSGEISRINPDTRAVTQAGHAKGRYLTGLAISRDNETLYATDEFNGALYKFDQRTSNPEGELLIEKIDGTRLYWANDTAWTPQGPVFTTSSQSRGFGKFFEELVEHSGTGQLILYDTGAGQEDVEKGEVIVNDLHMANGVAWAGGTELLVVETSAYRVVKIDWDTNERSKIVDNLPGFPGNIRAAVDRPGIFWVTLISPRSALIDNLADKPLLRRLLAWLPTSLRPSPTAFPCIVELDMMSNPPEFHTYRLESDKPLPSFSTVIENKGQLYLSPAGLAGVDDRRIITAHLP